MRKSASHGVNIRCDPRHSIQFQLRMAKLLLQRIKARSHVGSRFKDLFTVKILIEKRVTKISEGWSQPKIAYGMSLSCQPTLSVSSQSISPILATENIY